jgi:hypothetical protein
MNEINDLFNRARKESEAANFDEKAKPCGSQRIPRIPYKSPQEFIPALSQSVSSRSLLYFTYVIVAILLCVSCFFLGQKTTSNAAKSGMEKQEEIVSVQEEQFDFGEFLNNKIAERYGASFLPSKREYEELNIQITESRNEGTSSKGEVASSLRTEETSHVQSQPAQPSNNTFPQANSENAMSPPFFSKIEQKEEYYLTPTEKSLIEARERLHEYLQGVNVDF